MGVWDDIEEDLDSTWFDTDGLARTVTYAGQSVRVQYVFGEEWSEETGSTRNVVNMLVKAEDVARPDYRDAVVIAMPGDTGDETWYVEEIFSGNGLVWQIRLMQEERPKL